MAIYNNNESLLEIIDKCGYSISSEPFESDEDEYEYENETEETEDGCYWQNDSNRSALFGTEAEAIADCLKNLDPTGYELTDDELSELDDYQ